jgi:hypothetical protein
MLATVVAPVEGGSAAGPAGHGRPLASRRISWMLEPSLATATGKATHRFTTSNPHSANGHGEPSLGRSADPRRVAETRSHRLGTHGVAVSTRPTDGTVADLAYFLTNHLGNLAFASTVTSLFGESDDDGVDACGLPFRPVPPSRDGRYASSQWAFVDWPPSLPPTSHAWRVAHDQLPSRTCTRFSSGKDPPQPWIVDISAGGVRLEVPDVPGLHLDEGVHVV